MLVYRSWRSSEDRSIVGNRAGGTVKVPRKVHFGMLEQSTCKKQETRKSIFER